ncbi:hypothetical protein QBC46DRAFT_3005 [Diplogelasinospora grovesii]|uniref:Uncharacterized protein n=1 Tax=Diplogelasinospora grovesii TaxID=303347 RepID=A0AAN6NJZ8_9PEZI|nr:hypothetical protein QBC46DRAFT_3005 [Diplogelasinospora grovesii]
MSGSGGFYKYRCKYFYTHNCPNWVWVNNAPCASCLAEGRDADENVSNSTAAPSAPWRLGKEIYVPQVYDGTLQYTLMEIVATGESGNYWTLRHKVTQQPLVTQTMTTSDTPRAVYVTTGVPMTQMQVGMGY